MVSPNIELKFSKDEIDDLSIQKPITIKIGNVGFTTSFLELQIAYKEEILKSDKDFEDARHMRMVAENHLDMVTLNHYKQRLKQ